MRILLTGSTGMLGSEIKDTSNKYGLVTEALDRKAFLNASWPEQSAMLEGFDVIIHAAANTDLEECERNQIACFNDNCFLTERLFKSARHNKVKFVYISSTGIYGRHKDTPYHEYDEVYPTTVHHRSKYIAERLVLKHEESLVLRTGWLFGGNFNHKRNFVANRIREARNSNGLIYSNSMQFGSPTYVKDLVERIFDLLIDNSYGIYNVVNAGNVSRYEYVKMIVALSNLDVDVLPADSNIFNRLADVSDNEAATTLRMNFENRTPMRKWDDALHDYMNILQF